MFEIKTTPFGPISEVKLINTKTGEYAAIVPGYGATINGLALAKNSTLHELVDGSASHSELLGDGTSSYKGMVLFPYPNRIKDGMYTYAGRMYKFDTNEAPRNNSLHGLLFNAPLEVKNTQAGADKAELQLVSTFQGEHPAYPFKVTLSISIVLDSKGFHINSVIESQDTKPFPVGLGWHPYLKTGSKVDTLEFELPKHKQLPVDDRMVPTGKTPEGFSFLSLEPIEAVSLDNGYQLCGNEEISITKIFDPAKDITLQLWQKRGAKGYEYLQVYTPPHRNSIAIEPQSCAPDAFNNKLGLIEIQPGEKLSFDWGLELV